MAAIVIATPSFPRTAAKVTKKMVAMISHVASRMLRSMNGLENGIFVGASLIESAAEGEGNEGSEDDQ